MTTSEWIAQAKQDADDLRALIARWHPQAGDGSRRYHGLPITATNAERACEGIRRELRETLDAAVETGVRVPTPIERFDAGLADGDVSAIMAVLNEAWFGVPESTACWRERGFRQAVALLEDSPRRIDSATQ